MANDWQTVRLGEFLTEPKEFVTIDDFTCYKRARNQWYGKGIVLRDEIYGSEIKTKQQQIVRAGEFVVAEIDAKEGSFGIVPSDLDGAIVSSHYFVFQVNEDVCLRSWLDLLSRANLFQEQVRAQGSTNYSAVRPNQVLAFEIPLPPLSEQKRIVARVDALARRVEEARGLRRAAVEEAEAVMGVALSEIFDESKPLKEPAPIGETNLKLNSVTRNPAKEISPKEFLYVDISAVEGGTGRITSPQKILGADAPSRARRGIRKGDVIVSTVRPNLKGFALVPPELDDQICSTGFAVFTCPDSVIPQFLLYQFFSPYFLTQAEALVTGGHYPALNDKAIRSIRLMLPDESTQRRIVAYLDGLQAKVDELRRLQAATQKELDALMPSILAKAFAGEL
jgi:type I restriction enzyme S subunit